MQALYELYRSRKEKVLRSWSEVRRIMEKEVLPPGDIGESTRIGLKRTRRGESRNRDRNALAIACSRATSYANSGPRSMKRRRRTLTVHRSRDCPRR